ncbi:MAG: hypothetical protein K6G57_04745 [Lachnospiraceae bacterium]|nr:hypothetical protein [Lachnospiraceae bacterium]
MVRRSLKYFLYIGFSIQIILGIIWGVLNISAVQPLGEFQVKMLSEKGYAGAASLIYLIQFALALYSVGYFFVSSGIVKVGRKTAIWCAFAINTFPMIMQVHMALLPYSLLFSLTFLFFSFYAEKRPLPMCMVWILSAVVMPEYGALLLIPALVAVIKSADKKSVKIAMLTAVIAVSAGSLVCGGICGHRPRTVAETMYEKVAWSFYTKDSWRWMPVFYDTLGQESMETAMTDPGKVDSEIVRRSIDKMGKDEAEHWFDFYAKVALKESSNGLLPEIAKDALGNAVSPVMMIAKFKGIGNHSYMLGNYAAMKRHTPMLTKIYVYFGLCWFPVAVAAGMICSTIMLIGKNRTLWKAGGSVFLFMILTGGMMAAWHTLTDPSGTQDYKVTTFVTSLWLIFGLCGVDE